MVSPTIPIYQKTKEVDVSDDQNNEWRRPSGFAWTVEDLAREL